MNPNEMTFGEHLEDLRKRLFYALLGLLPTFIIGLVVGRDLLTFLIRPVQEELLAAGLPAVLMATSPLETFGAYVRIAVVVTLLVGSPWVLYQLWRFVAPGLYRHERRFVHILVPLSSLLTAAGVVFLYTVILPVILAFFIQFGSTLGKPIVPTAPLPEGVQVGRVPVLRADPESFEPGQMWVHGELMQLRVAVPGEGPDTPARIVGAELTGGAGIVQQYRVSEYVKMFLSLCIAFALGFQTPVVVLLLGWAGLVTPALLGKYRRQAGMAVLVASAILTPADPVSMVLLAVPLYLLYELGGLLLRLMPASKVAGDREWGEDWTDFPDEER
ncbi:MAG: twin-arginine translocase subunit TatC [Phycisphaerales bacterium JB037]